MNKKVNSILFLIGATVFNIVILFFYFLAFLGISGLFLPIRDGFLAQIVWIVLFLAALISDWFTYRLLFRIIREKVPLEKYFDMAIFRGKF